MTNTLRNSGGRPSSIFVLLSFTLVLAATACRRDMFVQPRENPLSENTFFQDNHMASRPLVPHTVARGHLDEDTVLITGKIGTNLVETFPFPITRRILQRGRERFDIYCAPCHGPTGDGRGMIVQRGFPPPPSFHIDRLRQAPGRPYRRCYHPGVRDHVFLRGKSGTAGSMGYRRVYSRTPTQPQREARGHSGGRARQLG